ncbi:helix-turn-helix domain-containing protein [Streptomyces sp. NPDC047434]|uniref:helix-turn-helix domain-containing protein n=1 Tax=Streptomyces sp. NPDC047434 TaxID=3155143 RepID=UPI00340FEB1E
MTADTRDRKPHPNAKDDLRAKARTLRAQGRTYDEITRELGCSKSSVSLWVRDMQRPEPRRRTREQASEIAKRGWEDRLRLREEERNRAKHAAASEVGPLSDRELFLLGVGLYWAEGTKDKPHARRERVAFINSDPGMIKVFLAWLDLLGVDRERHTYRVLIHETADIGAAERYWAAVVDADASRFGRTTLKRHNPTTIRKNVNDDYRGCLVIHVRQSADLYRRIEGAWCGIVGAASAAVRTERT